MGAASILLIEPNEDSRTMYAEYLQMQNFTCVTAETAEDGLARAKAADVIVTGIRLHGSFDGLELVRRLRVDADTKDIPVVVLTACAYPADERRALDAGCNRFLAKPCLPGRLVNELQKLLAASQRQPQPQPRISVEVQRSGATTGAKTLTTRLHMPQ